MILPALRGEMVKLYHQRIVWAGVAMVLVLVILVVWGSHHERDRFDAGEMIGSEFIVTGNTVTALFVARAVMQVALVVFVPMLIAVVAGAMVAGERQLGTLRTLLSRPVRRSTVLLSKLAAAWSYAVLLTLLLGLSALALGQLVFGWGDLVVLRQGLTIFDPQTGLMRLAQGYALAALAMGTVATVALMLSAIVDNPMTAAGLTVAFLLISQIVAVMPYFESIEPHLLTTHLDIFNRVFAPAIETGRVWRSVAYLSGYSVVATVVALVVFGRRDVTS
ncbi:MAG: ABC transporter permease subunit [candidate division WS1 bacterium]|jgi:ABC-2 type transport system permease protein|nr:ABC transporter permease subunit [candidate division WS1 bacterium]